MDKLVKGVIVLAALLAGIGVFYYFVVFLPNIENQKLELERQKTERAETEKRAAATQAASQEMIRQKMYDECKRGARTNYEVNWATACKTNARLRTSELQNCLTDRAIMANQYMGESYCRKTFSAEDASPDCALPISVSSPINQTLKDEDQRCLAEAKSGL